MHLCVSCVSCGRVVAMPMPKRKRAGESDGAGTAPTPGAVPVQQVNTMNNYFSTVQVPTSAGKEDEPPHLFPGDERRHWDYVQWGKRTRPYRVTHVLRSGAIKAGCTCCTRNYLDAVQFAPPECNNNARRRPQFLDALEKFSIAHEERDLDAAREARATIEALRNALCPSCQKTHDGLSPAQQACKDEWASMRQAACEANDGCANPACAERGPQAWWVLQADHLHTATEEDEAKRKTHQLSEYTWWSWNGGVEAMRAEAAKGVQYLCAFCHCLENTSNQANRCMNPDELPDGKRSGTEEWGEEERKQYEKKRKAKITFPKQQHVDAHKREIGCCAFCKRSDVGGREVAFHFDHIDPATKLKGRNTIAGETGGVSGLVCNGATSAKLDALKQTLDAEMDKCQLLCANCHHRKTWGYPMRV